MRHVLLIETLRYWRLEWDGRLTFWAVLANTGYPKMRKVGGMGGYERGGWGWGER